MGSCHITTPDRSIGAIAESDSGCSVLGAWYIPHGREITKLYEDVVIELEVTVNQKIIIKIIP